MKNELCKIREIDEKVKGRLEYIKSNNDSMMCDINTIKALKNNIYEKTSKIFIYNLKKLIQLEITQKNLAKKIGVSEDLLSKYKSAEAFPSIETLIYICEVYNISIDKLTSIPLTAADMENLENNMDINTDIFEDKYYVYFLVTNIAREGAIHEGIVEFFNDNVVFKILSNGQVVKLFKGDYNTFDKLIFFNLQSADDGITYINMAKPNVNKNKYVGGIALLMLPSDANSKPCVQKILFSEIRIDRELHYERLKKLLNFSCQETTFEHIKLSSVEDEDAYNFIRKLI
ncbi:helix-turn-helix transcriptional regulator [Clostridium sporogenes]|uniref:helix-turn-helix domain-containing protein n=1 Tax=Clostridium sporogenes TaxID=1509 RepID=UPI001C116756|nr:helix-turn-helix transcriptional regulator [Clostridium sporogenes]MBU5299280.1 helix-turn-helix transcriptional regulator [Clostridium sporogenes]